MNEKNYRRVAVKIGSNVLSRSDGMLDITRMSSLVDQVAALRGAGIEVIMISSGAVASGHSELRGVETRALDSVEQRQLYSAVGQAKLINRYYELFREHHLAVGQVLTMKESFATRRHYLNQRGCMEVMLEAGVIPIVNENDTISVTELMFTDNDELSGLIATMMNVDALIILSNVDGIYTGAPDEASSRLLEVVAPDDDLSRYIKPQRSGFGRGGMITKCGIARKVAAEGIEVIIANGKTDNVLPRLLIENDPALRSTRFIPSSDEISSIKRWMAHSSGFAKGAVTLNSGALARLTGYEAVSLLPVGVTEIEGEWEKDDLINILSPDKDVVGVGRAAYSSVEAAAAIGQHDQRPLVHYDYLYIK
ncbi:MAG: glutamate 5-kinase [Bacteroides sp.]|nr:glutamate 5-kinase [Bacteroides sp.]MCM1413720.1 glutamate 5-kinase [Bacteroides sp.]MCM1471899.1 glutamate 5-kinase [Bacteroides sp.]